MGVLSRLLGTDRTEVVARSEPPIMASLENPSSGLASPQQWLVDYAMGGMPGGWGPPVSERSAMAISAVFRCVTLLSGVIATLPRKVYQTTEDGRQEVTGIRLIPLLKLSPFPGRPMTAHVWFERMVTDILLWGNHFAIIRYDNAARIVAFEALLPWNVEVWPTPQGRVIYRCILFDGSVEYVDHEDMLHIPGPGFDGYKGLSRIGSFARQSVAMASAVQDQIGRTFENAARPSGVLEIPPGVSEDGFKRMLAQFGAKNTGGANAGRTFFADQGAKYTPLQMSMADLSAIEAMRYSVADISRFFGPPLHLLNETDKSTSWGAGLSEQTLAFLIFTLDNDLSRIEAEFNGKLFPGGDIYFEFSRDALLAMDPLKAAQVVQAEFSFGGIIPNEYRRMKNRPPVEGGDIAFRNSTNVPLTAPAPTGPVPATPPAQPPA